MKTRTMFALLAVGLLAGGSAVANEAAEAPAVLVADAAGDANGLNSQSNAATGPNGPDTRPASIDSADIRSVSAETTYTKVKQFDFDGKVSRVLYYPDGLSFHVTMEGNVKPTFGPGLLLRIFTRVNRPSGGICEAWFQAWWRGPQSLPEDQERADIRRLTAAPACPAVNTIFNGFTQTVDGKTITMHYPLSAPGMAGFIENGTRIDPPQVFTNNPNYIHLRLQAAVVPTVPGVTTGPTILTSGQIDEAAIFPGFTVGEDVPATVECAVTPEHPECQPATA